MHEGRPTRYGIPNVEFRTPNSEFSVPNSKFRVSPWESASKRCRKRFFPRNNFEQSEKNNLEKSGKIPGDAGEFVRSVANMGRDH